MLPVSDSEWFGVFSDQRSVTLKKASFEKSFTRKKFHSNTSEDDTALDGTAEKV